MVPLRIPMPSDLSDDLLGNWNEYEPILIGRDTDQHQYENVPALDVEARENDRQRSWRRESSALSSPKRIPLGQHVVEHFVLQLKDQMHHAPATGSGTTRNHS